MAGRTNKPWRSVEQKSSPLRTPRSPSKRSPGAQACALHYEQRLMSAPEVGAIGRREAVSQMRREARRFGIPVVTDAPLAESLCGLMQNEPIPPALYEPVARVFLRAKRSK